MLQSAVKTKNGKQAINAFDVDEVQLPLLTFKWVVRQRKKTYYATDFLVADTETSHTSESDAWIYQWALKVKSTYIYGRTPSEFIKLLAKMSEFYKLRDDKKIILYIHNAAYDIQYLKHFLRRYDPDVKILCTDAHSVLTCDIFGFRILCSYRLTNCSLAVLAKNYATLYEKAVGEIDYSHVYYQDDELPAENWYYMFSDVASQMDGIRGYLNTMGYAYAYEAPITSTGFVRNDTRAESRTDTSWRETFTTTQLDLDMYYLCRWGFMGGVTISSFLYSGQTIRGDLGHDDFISSYPGRQELDYFPIGAPSWYGEIENRKELQFVLDTYCCVFELTLYDVHIKPGIYAPYIPSSKCIGLINPVRCNGKIVYAERLTIAVTEVDFKWIDRQYTFNKISINNMLVFRRGKLPKWFRKVVYKYFENKCSLKHSDPIMYSKSKSFLNAIYGMTATAIIRDKYEMGDDMTFSPKKYGDDAEEAVKNKRVEDLKQLNQYYRSYNSFLPYQWALWTTAWARDALFTMIEVVGYENFLYCDTDSVFYIKTPENVKRMEEYRKQCEKRAIDAGVNVGEKCLGAPAPEPPIRAFRSLHAKCYAVEEMNDAGEYELKVTIAGIPKKSIKWIDGKPIEKTNADELGNIDNLNDGFVFSHNGGTRCIYSEREIENININGHMIELASAAVIENITKEISDTMYSIEDGNFINALCVQYSD